MLPQGFGRQELLRRIGKAPTAGASADWQLLLTGGRNSIGNLRVKEAATWLAANPGAIEGFTDEEVAQQGDEFSEDLANNGVAMGLEPSVHSHLRLGIEARANELEKLR